MSLAPSTRSHEQLRPSPDGSPHACSVVMCVYTETRWSLIVRALESVRGQTLPPTETIVVVDHNDALARRLETTFDDVAVVLNSRERGLSGARNTGVDRATSDIVAFLDDDAWAEPTWLEAMLEPFQDQAVMGAGGLILPDWGAEGAPRWLPDEFLWTVGCSYRGLPTSTADVRNPIGASMSFRRSVFDLVGSFDPQVGRNDSGSRPLGCEETELSIRLRQKLPDARIVYEPRSVAHHTIDRSRSSWRYFRARCFAEGLSKQRIASLVGATDALRVERGYVASTLLGAAGRQVMDSPRPIRDRVLTIFVIVVGVGWAMAGYGRGLLGRETRPSRIQYEPARTRQRSGT
jgi:glucosyl-dolichyl phosphate glucuronosyltransferase